MDLDKAYNKIEYNIIHPFLTFQNSIIMFKIIIEGKSCEKYLTLLFYFNS